MRTKAKVTDRVVLNSLAPKHLQKRYGTRTGVVVNLESVGDSYLRKGYSRSRIRYLVHFGNGDGTNEALWSYEFNTLK